MGNISIQSVDVVWDWCRRCAIAYNNASRDPLALSRPPYIARNWRIQMASMPTTFHLLFHRRHLEWSSHTRHFFVYKPRTQCSSHGFEIIVMRWLARPNVLRTQSQAQSLRIAWCVCRSNMRNNMRNNMPNNMRNNMRPIILIGSVRAL